MLVVRLDKFTNQNVSMLSVWNCDKIIKIEQKSIYANASNRFEAENLLNFIIKSIRACNQFINRILWISLWLRQSLSISIKKKPEKIIKVNLFLYEMKEQDGRSGEKDGEESLFNLINVRFCVERAKRSKNVLNEVFFSFNQFSVRIWLNSVVSQFKYYCYKMLREWRERMWWRY